MSGGQRFPAHRLILSISSPIFEVMLNPPAGETKVTLPIEVKLGDVEAATFRSLLQCIYSDYTGILPSFLSFPPSLTHCRLCLQTFTPATSAS